MLAEKWQVRLLGGLSINMAGREVARFRTRKAGALLGYLAYNSGRPQPREMLLDMLWPDKEIDEARNLLSVTLNSLRRQLEPPGVPQSAVLHADRNDISLNSEAVIIDAILFQAEMREARIAQTNQTRSAHLERALAHYCGELLPGYYEDWIFVERARLASLCGSGLRQLSQLLSELGDYESAIMHAGHVAALEPLCESTQRELLHLLIKTGRHGEARKQYEKLVSALKESSGSAPEEETTSLASKIREGSAAVVSTGAPASGTSRPNEGSNRARARNPDNSGYSLGYPAHPGNLPLPLTRFFGRESEMSQLRGCLITPEAGRPGPRLITLTGPGGSGKTRLAIETSSGIRGSFAGGIWFVPLADVPDPANIADTVRDALGLARDAVISPMEQTTRMLASKPALLILDNFEHLLHTAEATGTNRDDHAALYVRDLLGRAPDLTCIVTSRELLDVAGEQEFPVPLLETPLMWSHAPGSNAEGEPTEAVDISPERLMQYAGVRLFVDRAQLRKIDFQVTPGNASAVAELCSRLEGLPLALELAAAWAQTLTPAQMLERLAHRFDLLVSRGRGAPERHRSLRAALDSSYRLLSAEQRLLLGRLSVFSGGWTVESAEAICLPAERKEQGEPSWIGSKVLENLAHPRDASMIVMEDAGGEARYSFLESLRQFAAEQLNADESAELADRHAQIFVALVEEIEPKLSGPEQVRCLDRLEREYDNFRAALKWCLDSEGGAEIGLRLVGALQGYWFLRNRKEGRRWSNVMLTHPGGLQPSLARAKALCTAVHLTPWGSDYTSARDQAEESVQICRQLNCDSQLPASQLALAHAILNSPKLRGEEHIKSLEVMLQQALAQYQGAGDMHGALRACQMLSLVTEGLGNAEAARDWCVKALGLGRKASDASGIARCLHTLAQLAEADGDWRLAYTCCEERLIYERMVGHWDGISHALYSRGSACLHLGDSAAALSSFQESLKLNVDRSEYSVVASHLFFIGAAALMVGKPIWSARILGAAERIGASQGISRTPAHHRWDPRWDAAIDGARSALRDAAFTAHRDEGCSMTTEQAIALALEERIEPTISQINIS